MKLTGTYNGKLIELELTEEQIEVLKKAEKKKTGWERSEQSQTYYVNYADGYGLATESFDSIDANRYEKANYFSNETLAEDIQRAQTLQRKLWRRSAELCEKVDWRNPETEKYCIRYDYDDDDFLRDTPRLVAQHGGEEWKWEKKSGIIKTDNFTYEVHWYEYEGKQYDNKLKRKG